MKRTNQPTNKAERTEESLKNANKRNFCLKVEIRKKKKREHMLLDMVQVAAAKKKKHLSCFVIFGKMKTKESIERAHFEAFFQQK